MTRIVPGTTDPPDLHPPMNCACGRGLAIRVAPLFAQDMKTLPADRLAFTYACPHCRAATLVRVRDLQGSW